MPAPTPPRDLKLVFASPNSSERLRAALSAGSQPVEENIEVLIHRWSVEPDFYVRDMLTWALLRHNPDKVYQLLQEELGSAIPQARSQALHTLTKIGKPETWGLISENLLFDEDDEVRRTAWRVAATFAPVQEQGDLAEKLVSQLGVGGTDVRMSLSRALGVISEVARPLLQRLSQSADEEVVEHAKFTLALIEDPEFGHDASVSFAVKTKVLKGAPVVPEDK